MTCNGWVVSVGTTILYYTILYYICVQPVVHVSGFQMVVGGGGKMSLICKTTLDGWTGGRVVRSMGGWVGEHRRELAW